MPACFWNRRGRKGCAPPARRKTPRDAFTVLLLLAALHVSSSSVHVTTSRLPATGGSAEDSRAWACTRALFGAGVSCGLHSSAPAAPPCSSASPDLTWSRTHICSIHRPRHIVAMSSSDGLCPSFESVAHSASTRSPRRRSRSLWRSLSRVCRTCIFESWREERQRKVRSVRSTRTTTNK